MLYEVITLAVSSSKIDIPIQKIYGAARSIVDMDTFLEILLFNAMQGLSADRRITSYNVCYTKLLRLKFFSIFWTTRESMYTKFLRSWITKVEKR